MSNSFAVGSPSPPSDTLPWKTPDPYENPVLAKLDAFECDEPASSYQEGFDTLTQLTLEALQKRHQEAALKGEGDLYAYKPYDNTIDMYKNVLPFVYNTATYPGGYISGSVMPNGSVAMAGVMETNASRVAAFLFAHKVPILMRLTAHQQNGVEKSLDWIQNEKKWGDFLCKIENRFKMVLVPKNEEKGVTILKTIFTLTKEGETHRIIELYVENWADGDIIPPKAVIIALRTLRAEINTRDEETSETIPYIIHCSAGVGRTGVLNVCQRILDEIKNNRYPNIPQITLETRLARHPFSVMTVEQLKLCYDVKTVCRAQWKHTQEKKWTV